MTTILFLAANPNGTDRLRLDEEVRTIDTALQQADGRDRFEFETHWALRVDDLQALMLRYEPAIVHFSGHGSDAGEIVLQDAQGEPVVVPAEALSQLFHIFRDNVRCVLLNACYSADQAVGIAAEIDTVIGMSDAISDNAARRFSSAFYRGLGYGKSVATAFDLGCNAIDLAALDEGDKPVIGGKADAEMVVLAAAESAETSSESDLEMDARRLLDVLINEREAGRNSMSVTALAEQAGLSDKRFKAADAFLRRKRYVNGTSTLRYVTQAGIEFW